MKLEFDLSCPHCKRNFKQALKDVIPDKTRKCPHCGVNIQFTGDDGRKAQKALDDFERSLKKLSKDFKIKL